MDLKQLEEELDKVPKEVIDSFSKRNLDIFSKKFEEFTTSNTKNIAVYIFKGIILEETRKYSEAVKYLDIFIDKYPDFFIANKIRGRCLVSLGSYSLARDVFGDYLRIKFNDAEVWCYVAICYYLEGKKGVAVELLDHILNEVDNKAIISLLRGMLCENEGMNEDALISYIQSQISSIDNEERDIAGRKIFNLFNK